MEEDINMKNQFQIKNLQCPVENEEVVCISYVDNKIIDPSILRNNAHVNSKDKNLDKFVLLK